jgi:hypothetical protein
MIKITILSFLLIANSIYSFTYDLYVINKDTLFLSLFDRDTESGGPSAPFSKTYLSIDGGKNFSKIIDEGEFIQILNFNVFGPYVIYSSQLQNEGYAPASFYESTNFGRNWISAGATLKFCGPSKYNFLNDDTAYFVFDCEGEQAGEHVYELLVKSFTLKEIKYSEIISPEKLKDFDGIANHPTGNDSSEFRVIHLKNKDYLQRRIKNGKWITRFKLRNLS